MRTRFWSPEVVIRRYCLREHNMHTRRGTPCASYSRLPRGVRPHEHLGNLTWESDAESSVSSVCECDAKCVHHNPVVIRHCVQFCSSGRRALDDGVLYKRGGSCGVVRLP